MIADGVTIEDAKERHQDRRALGMLYKAVKQNWPISDAMVEAAPKIATRVMMSEKATARDQLRAIEVLAAMRRDNINTLVALDKIERCEDGAPTEIVTLTLMPPRIARLNATANTGAK